MDTRRLIDSAQALVAGDKGLLAMDESTPTCDKRFAALGIPRTEEARRAYRDMIVTTPRLGECISGAILYDETIRQTTLRALPFARALEAIPSRGCIDANAYVLARYAALCQEVGLVPIVEPEVLMDGKHTLARSGCHGRPPSARRARRRAGHCLPAGGPERHTGLGAPERQRA